MKIGNWEPKKTVEKLQKNPAKAIGYGVAGYMGGPATLLAGAYDVGGKKAKEKINAWTGGLAGEISKGFEGIGKEVKKGKDSLSGKAYKPSDYEIDTSAFKTGEGYDQSVKDFTQKGQGFGRDADLYQGRALAAQGRIAPRMNQGDSDDWRWEQQNLATQLAEQAAGRGPSLATLQMQQGTDDAIKSAMALAATGRSGTAGGRLKAAQDQAAALQQQNIRDSAAARIQEQLSARQQLAGVLGQGREQDIGIAAQDLGAQLTTQGQADQYGLGLGNLGLGYDKLGLGYDQLALQGQQLGSNDLQELEKLKLQKFLEMEKLKQQGIASENMSFGNMLQAGGALGAGAIAAFSDKNLKKNIKDGDGAAKDFLTKIADEMGISKEPDYSEMSEGDRVKEFLSRLKSYEYDYKDPAHGEGKKVSPMAQDLEQDPLSQAMVMDTPEGKMVNYDQPGLMLAGLATLSRENDELRSMVEKLAKKRGA